MEDGLLIEILSEELPPRSLSRLSEVFGTNLYDQLSDAGLLPVEATEYSIFATPRRLAAYFPRVRIRQEDRESFRRGPKEDAPIEHVQGFARGCGVSIEQLEKANGFYCLKKKVKGEPASKLIPEIVNKALKSLPVSKTMRWGAGETQFVRPVHGVILLHGKKVVPGTVLGCKSGNKTLGHRFLSKSAITIPSAKDYERLLKKKGKVISHFEARRDAIAKGLDAAAKKAGKSVRWDLGKAAELVDEVACLVEHPVVHMGTFDQVFLDVPKECLVVSMQQHQKYFPLAGADGKLLNKFLFVANMKAANPKHIIHGNERVLRARLSDARFFYDQDRKHKLEERVPRLAHVVYHNKLGSQLERVQRLTKLAGEIAHLLKTDAAGAERAAYLCKADLLTEMVGEFPELQGIMGHYYALHDGESAFVAGAIEQHYFPKGAGGELPAGPIALSVALADKLDTLTGIFGIGLAPTGEKDPFGLRRAALGVVRILIEKQLPLDVRALFERARGQFPGGVVAESVAQDLYGFLLERLKPYLREQGFRPDEIDAVLSLNPTRLDQTLKRLEALQAFRRLPEAEALAAANKRIRNILRQAGGKPAAEVNPALLREDAEKHLAEQVAARRTEVEPLFHHADYGAALKRLASLRPAVDAFFDKVMVMTDDPAVRNNRLALLNNLSELFLGAADISRLQS
ncbi:MAG: glycine--tRNA ligase subunit beta [Gammaproteobacteria bacterium]|nr:MAG: glycine--tRNA ligase subunit beta [Gammaproteobacteria bacterium]